MKILLLAWAGSVHTARIASSLKSQGCTVEVVSFRPAVIPGVPVHVLGLAKALGRIGYLLSVPRLRRLISQLKPDILHAHYLSSYGAVAAFSGFRPYIVSVWGSDVFDFPRRSLWARRLVSHTLNKADRILSTSHYMASEVARYTMHQVDVTPFGVDVDLFRPLPEVRPKDTIIIGSVKALEPQYGMDVVIKAFSQANSKWKGPALRLELVGRGREEGRLKKMADRLGVSGLVDFTGFVEHSVLPSRINRYTLAVFGSVCQESFGVSLLEAQACGVPVVASDVGGFREVVRENQTGILVPRGDYRAMAEAMLVLLSDSQKREKYSEAARDFIVREYPWKKTVEQFIGIYKKLLNVSK